MVTIKDDVKRQIIKALAYGESKETIKSVMGVTDADVDSIPYSEIEAEKKYYEEMGLM